MSYNPVPKGAVDFQLNVYTTQPRANNNFEFAPSGGGGGTTGYIKWWSGSGWVSKPVKYWTGGAWVQKPVKWWTGSVWQLSHA